MSESGEELSVDSTKFHWGRIVFYVFVVFFLSVLPALLTWIVRSDGEALKRWGVPIGPSALYVGLGGGVGLMCGIARNKLSSMLFGLNVGAGLGLCFSFLEDSRALGVGIPQAYFAAVALILVCGITRYDKDEGIVSFWNGCGTGVLASVLVLLALATVSYVMIYPGLGYWSRTGTIGPLDFLVGTMPPIIGSAFIFYRMLRVEQDERAGGR